MNPSTTPRSALSLCKAWIEADEGRSLGEILDIERRSQEQLGKSAWNETFVAMCRAVQAELMQSERVCKKGCEAPHCFCPVKGQFGDVESVLVPREDLAAACCAVNRDRWLCNREGDADGEAAMVALHDRLSLLYVTSRSTPPEERRTSGGDPTEPRSDHDIDPESEEEILIPKAFARVVERALAAYGQAELIRRDLSKLMQSPHAERTDG